MSASIKALSKEIADLEALVADSGAIAKEKARTAAALADYVRAAEEIVPEVLGDPNAAAGTPEFEGTPEKILPIGEFAAATSAHDAAVAAVAALTDAADPTTGGPLTQAKIEKENALDAAKEHLKLVQAGLEDRLGGTKLEELRDALKTAREKLSGLELRPEAEEKNEAGDVTKAAVAGGLLGEARADLEAKENAEKAAKAALNEAVTQCQIDTYDEYREALATAVTERKEDLRAIRDLLTTEAKNKPAAGALGARCEKALSNGTLRPSRNTAVAATANDLEPDSVCGAGLCCGAARVPLPSSGEGSPEAGWRTIETC